MRHVQAAGRQLERMAANFAGKIPYRAYADVMASTVILGVFAVWITPRGRNASHLESDVR
jgi:hypothetical protein